MGKQDIIQVLTPDHSVEAVFLDEEATIGHLLAALAEDNPDYGQDWTVVEVAMPRTGRFKIQTICLLDVWFVRFFVLIKLTLSYRAAALTYPELYALDQGISSS